MTNPTENVPSERVLVVEDDAMLQAFLALHLEQEGFEVLTAASGEEMFRVLGEDDVDLILLDLNLPDGDGLTLAQKIREHSNVPIVIATARKSRDDRMIALGLGADDYVTKPFDPEELALRIRNVIGRAQGGVSGGNREGGRTPRSPESRRPRASGKNIRNRMENLFPEIPAGENGGGLAPPGPRRWRIAAAASMLTAAAVIGALWLTSSPAPLTRTAQESGSAVTDRLGADQRALTGTKKNLAWKAPARKAPASKAPAPVKPVSVRPAPAATPANTLVNAPAATPGDILDEVTTRPMAEILGYGWVLKSRCDAIPQITWWKYKSHESLAAYVNRRYRGNWLPYLGKWVRRLVKLQDIHNRNSSAVTSSGLVLRGPELEDYINQTKKRLFVTRCLADEAKKAADAKTKSPDQYRS